MSLHEQGPPRGFREQGHLVQVQGNKETQV